LTSKEEYNRILDNPDHIILSDELKDLLGNDEKRPDTEHSKSDNSFPTLVVGENEFSFQVEKIKRLDKEKFTFTGLATEFSVASLIAGDVFGLQAFGSHFALDEDHAIDYKSDGTLTFTARRIVKNEKVSI
jgi:hypothetical protein